MASRFTRLGGRIGVWMYRTLDGRLSSGSKEVHVLMITTQVMARTIRARPRELVDDERDAMWSEVVLGQAPEVAKYARRAGRVIPVAVLEPL